MSCQGRIPAPFELSEEWPVLRGAVSAGNTPRDRERKRKEEAAQVLIKMLLAVANYFDVPPENVCRRQSFIFILGNDRIGNASKFFFFIFSFFLGRIFNGIGKLDFFFFFYFLSIVSKSFLFLFWIIWIENLIFLVSKGLKKIAYFSNRIWKILFFFRVSGYEKFLVFVYH